MALCPTCVDDLRALVEERAGIAEIMAKLLQRDAEIGKRLDDILDGKH